MSTFTGMNPYEFPELFSKLILGTSVSPGTVVISGHDRWKDWDIQKAKGQTGATSKLNGDPVGQFTATFYLVSEGTDEDGNDDFTSWFEFQKEIEATVSGPTPVAKPVYHPDLQANGFTEVTSAGVGGITRDERGGATVVVKFLEYRPPKPKQTRKASGGINTQEARQDPNYDAKRELAGLLEEAKKP